MDMLGEYLFWCSVSNDLLKQQSHTYLEMCFYLSSGDNPFYDKQGHYWDLMF